jgi:hypothetical protein
LRHDFKWVEKLADDHFRDSRVQKTVIKGVILRVIKRAVKPYFKMMEEGINPIYPNSNRPASEPSKILGRDKVMSESGALRSME